MPKISIVIPAYNASNYLAEAIDSALGQTYPNVEIIVVNDGSKDDGATERVALSYGDKIRYFSKENGGSSSALNMGIANMTGDWFSWLSHDDLYVPEKVQLQVEFLEALQLSEEALRRHVLFSASDLIDGYGRYIRKAASKESLRIARRLESLEHNGHLIAEPTKYGFHGCSCLVHKSAFQDVGVFDEGLWMLNDMDLWFRIYKAGYKIHYLPEPLVKGRIHPKQVSKCIGYSYHNPEQDMFWKRSLDLLMERYPQEGELFFRFGRNAYLKTRDVDGDRAFAYLVSVDPSKRLKAAFVKRVYKIRARVHELGKRVYLKLKE
ncbi:MAG: glycosyltransferase [Oscillospiraceae bacterium]|nr:glycosyltransferase [Oscillospiraceae bacterium]